MFDTVTWHTAESGKERDIFTNLAEAGKTSDRHLLLLRMCRGRSVVVMFDKQKPLDLALGAADKNRKTTTLSYFQGHSNSSLRVRLFGFTLITVASFISLLGRVVSWPRSPPQKMGKQWHQSLFAPVLLFYTSMLLLWSPSSFRNWHPVLMGHCWFRPCAVDACIYIFSIKLN